MENKYKYVAYLRKSSESKEKQALSIRSQKREVETKFSEFNIVEWIEEEKSAFEPHIRPEFKRIMKMVEKGQIQGILAWHPDRLSRNEIDAAQVTYSVRKNVLKDLQFVSYDFKNTPDGIKQLQNALSDSQHSSAKLSVDVKRGLASKLKMGRMPCVAPIGYMNTKLSTRGENRIIKDPERFPIIRKMWDMLLTRNYSVPQIRDLATYEWGLRTPKKIMNGGGPLGYSSVYDMFRNIFYTGQFKYRGKIEQGDHTAMITLAEYDLAQTILKEHGNPRPKTYSFAYGSGCLACGECGYSFVGIEKVKYIKTTAETKTYTLYFCGGKKKVTHCSQRYNLNETNLEGQITTEVSKYAIDQDFLHWALEIIKENKTADISTKKVVKENVTKTLESTQNELKRLIQLATRGFISDDEFQESRSTLDTQINSLKSRTNEDEDRKERELLELTEKAFVFSTYALIALKNGDKQTKKEILKGLGLNRTVKDEKLNVIAFEWLVEVRKGYFALREALARFEPKISPYCKTIYDFPALRSLVRGWPDLNR